MTPIAAVVLLVFHASSFLLALLYDVTTVNAVVTLQFLERSCLLLASGYHIANPARREGHGRAVSGRSLISSIPEGETTISPSSLMVPFRPSATFCRGGTAGRVCWSGHLFRGGLANFCRLNVASGASGTSRVHCLRRLLMRGRWSTGRGSGAGVGRIAAFCSVGRGQAIWSY